MLVIVAVVIISVVTSVTGLLAAAWRDAAPRFLFPSWLLTRDTTLLLSPRLPLIEGIAKLEAWGTFGLRGERSGAPPQDMLADGA